MPKAILAFSGGLDTRFCVPYLKKKGFDVITVTVNTGGFNKDQLCEISEKSKKLGAFRHYEIDGQKVLYEKFASYLLKANYLKGGVYPACVGPERNVISMETVKIARLEKTNVIAHGSTGAGNDQARFDLAVRALLPHCTIVAPVRDENLTREQEVKFLEELGFPQEASSGKYSVNVGLLGTTISGAETLDPEKELPENIFPTVKKIIDTPDTPAEFTITLKAGLPVALNGKKNDGVALIQSINALAAHHGFGKDYHVGTTIIGIKGRVAFEAPALKVLVKAHAELEKLILTSRELTWKNILGTTYGDLVHEGLYFDPLCRDIEAFLDCASQFVEGEVTVRILKGNLTVASIKTPYSLMKSNLGTYGEKTGRWSGEEARGFCTLYGMESSNAYLHHKKKMP